MHCYDVMKSLSKFTKDEDILCAALLHDSIEDCGEDIENYLKFYNFSDKTLNLIKILTHDKSIPYEQYIENISKDEDATYIKICDLEDNLKLSRLPQPITIKDRERIAKYKKSLLFLRTNLQG